MFLTDLQSIKDFRIDSLFEKSRDILGDADGCIYESELTKENNDISQDNSDNNIDLDFDDIESS